MKQRLLKIWSFVRYRIEWDHPLLCIPIGLVVCFILIGVAYTTTAGTEARAMEDGIKAKNHAVPANANPYDSETGRKAWLEGWMSVEINSEAP